MIPTKKKTFFGFENEKNIYKCKEILGWSNSYMYS